MATRSEECIYCQAQVQVSKGAGDHIIPAALGEFTGDRRFRQICVECNSRIGRSEQQLLQSGIPALFRNRIGLVGRRGRKRKAGQLKSVRGARAPQTTVDLGDHSELVAHDPHDPTMVRYVDQVVLKDEEGQVDYVQLFPGMSVADLKQKIQRTGVRPKSAHIIASKQYFNEFASLVRAVLPGGRLEHQPDIEPGVQTVRGCTKFVITDHTFRAIAKIAFHYFLVHSRRRLRGSDDSFSAIRKFIMEGGNKDQFFRASDGRFVLPCRVLPDGRSILPSSWCHYLVADERRGEVVVCVQLFAGPECAPPAHYVTLGRIQSQLSFDDLFWGHVYNYESTGDITRAGRVEEMSGTLTNPWPV